MIELRNLSHAFLRKTLFDAVHLRLMPNERYGVVGANGSGKSTLLKIIAGEFAADDGDVLIDSQASMFRIGQEQSLNDQECIIEIAMMGRQEVFLALKEQDELLKDNAPQNAQRIAELAEIIENQGGYRLRADAETILEGLGIKSSFEEPLSVLSGGFKWRVFLAQALVKRPDILLLDEPTNHLDIVAIAWLEEFLTNYEGLIILVSHDRRFMDRVCTMMLDIDFETIKSYRGNFSAFEKMRRLQLLQKEKEIEAKEKEVAHKQAFVDRFRSKASKARQAQSRIKQIEKIVIEVPKRSTRVHPNFNFSFEEKGPKEVLEVKDLAASYGPKKVLQGVSFFVQRGQKIAVIGPNGAGKSTLMKALASQLAQMEGRVTWGSGVNLGYFPQDCQKIIKRQSLSALEWLWQFCAHEPQSYVQGMLGRMLIAGDDAKKPCSSLSGGELSRLYFAYLMLKKPNVLLLDEPTNHLDLESIESLSVSLGNFAGTLIVVSHDRDFIESVSESIIEVLPDKVNRFLGTYGEFVDKQGSDYLKVAAPAKHGDKIDQAQAKETHEEKKRKKALVAKLTKQLEAIMLDVEVREGKLQGLKSIFADDAFYRENDHAQVMKFNNEVVSLEAEISALLESWEKMEHELRELSERVL